MAKTVKIKQTLSEAHDVKAAWETVPDFKIGDLSLNDYLAVLSAADALDKEHIKSNVTHTGLKAKRNDKLREVSELITRLRSGIRGAYGPDSPIYEQAGGVRTSARKPRSRKTDAAAVPDSAPVPTPATAAVHA
jgi:hypothetical protein